MKRIHDERNEQKLNRATKVMTVMIGFILDYCIFLYSTPIIYGLFYFRSFSS